MLIKKAIDLKDLEVRSISKRMNRKDKWLLFWIAVFLIAASVGLFYIVNHWYE